MHTWVIKADKKCIELASFEEGRPANIFTKAIDCDLLLFFKEQLLAEKADEAFLVSDEPSLQQRISDSLSSLKIPTACFDKTKISLYSDTEETDLECSHLAANAYGALSLFPTFDCIVIDIADEIHTQIFSRDGKHLGSAIYPGYSLCAASTEAFKPQGSCMGLTRPTSAYSTKREEALTSGLYYGLLGAIERIVAEAGHHLTSRGSCKVIATGKMTENEDFAKDLADFTDLIDPRLVFRGLYEIHKEQKHNFKEK